MYSFYLTSIIEYREASNIKLLEKCLVEIANGDKNSLSVLYENTKSMVYGFALSILKDQYDAEDILQETYINIYKSAKDYASHGKPMAWIFTITRNLSLMKLRSNKNNPGISPEELEKQPAYSVESATDDKLVLQAALKWLSDEERQIVMLHAMAGLKHREISGILQLPVSTVLSKYHRAIKKLKILLMEGE